jgi:hypothetical protein
MSARNENLRKLERVNVTLVEYHRWLGHEFPEVERVLENLFIEFNSRPITGGEDVSSFRSVSNLREELRKMRSDTARLNWLLPNLNPANFGLDFPGGYEWDNEAELLRKWRSAIDSAIGGVQEADHEQLYDCEGISLESNKPFAFSCCDCGLTHHMVIVSEDGKPVGFAVKRIARAIAAALDDAQQQTGSEANG